MDQRCSMCGSKFFDGQEINASIVTKFKLIPSKVTFAFSTPKEVLSMRCHPMCYEEDK